MAYSFKNSIWPCFFISVPKEIYIFAKVRHGKTRCFFMWTHCSRKWKGQQWLGKCGKYFDQMFTTDEVYSVGYCVMLNNNAVGSNTGTCYTISTYCSIWTVTLWRQRGYCISLGSLKIWYFCFSNQLSRAAYESWGKWIRVCWRTTKPCP